MIAAGLLVCALNVHPVTIDAVVRVESSGNALAIHVNGLPGPQPHPLSVDDAVRIANLYISEGFSAPRSDRWAGVRPLREHQRWRAHPDR